MYGRNQYDLDANGNKMVLKSSFKIDHILWKYIKTMRDCICSIALNNS